MRYEKLPEFDIIHPMKAVNTYLSVLPICFIAMSVFFFPAFAGAEVAEEEEYVTPTEVGGLKFDMDEGVKIRQGPGGSVYVESNREYMQRKFRRYERTFEDHDARIEKLETLVRLMAADSENEEIKEILEPEIEASSGEEPAEGVRVLATE